MSITIYNRSGVALYTAETATTMREAVVAAVASKADLVGANLRSANLRSADLRSANLRSANLRGADLRSANLSGADLVGANLSGANLRGANLRSADLRSAYLSGAYIDGAYLSGADLRSANLRSANLRSADLRGAYLRGANLRGADLGGADLGGADLRSADLVGADLSGADLSGAYIDGANLSGAYIDGAYLRGAYLSGANLRGAIGLAPERVSPLHLYRYQLPGAEMVAFKLVNERGEGPFNGGIVYTPGETVNVADANTDIGEECGAGINVATLDWCLKEWREGYRILRVAFTAEDIAAIPTVTDGKFRLHRCRVVDDIDLASLGLVKAEVMA